MSALHSHSKSQWRLVHAQDCNLVLYLSAHLGSPAYLVWNSGTWDVGVRPCTLLVLGTSLSIVDSAATVVWRQPSD